MAAFVLDPRAARSLLFCNEHRNEQPIAALTTFEEGAMSQRIETFAPRCNSLRTALGAEVVTNIGRMG